MNLTPGQAHEAYVGPPSEPVDVAAFVKTASKLQDGSEGQCPLPVYSQSADALSAEMTRMWSTLSEDEQERIKNECCVDDLRTTLEETIVNPVLMGHVTRTHESTVHAIYETAEPSSRKKRKRTTLADPEEEHSDVAALRAELDATQLKCWPLTVHAASFIRPPRQPDHNTLLQVKKLGSAQAQPRDAVIHVTVYNRQSWGQRVLSRTSQHVLLSSQTLGDLYAAIPCCSKDLPIEIREGTGRISGYKEDTREEDMVLDMNAGAVMCVEGVLYGQGEVTDEYPEKVMAIASLLPEGKRPIVDKGPPMNVTKLSSLTLRLHEPYWVLHAGSCEHFFAITNIRTRHPSDPASGYPLTIQITPPLLDFCRVCTKVPAMYSIVGDIRLGESPYLICRPCWRWMGDPKDDSGVLVVPLPKYEQGWLSEGSN
ncbi:snRNA-activating protein of 50kDa MW C terminal-domain-containing protein [Lenzites betulinus]|nr:snRNA-activating protein of 50kDa MW C terminal-domain-containing protein [Lenzites betulinus]